MSDAPKDIYIQPGEITALKTLGIIDTSPKSSVRQRYTLNDGTMRETIKCSVCYYKEEMEQENCIHCNGTTRVVKP